MEEYMSTFGNHKFETLGITGSLYTFFKKTRNVSFDTEQNSNPNKLHILLMVSLPQRFPQLSGKFSIQCCVFSSPYTDLQRWLQLSLWL